MKFLKSLYNIKHWLYAFVEKAYEAFGSAPCGGNVYLYKKNNAFVCCALLYTKPKNEWIEVAASHSFAPIQIPQKVQKLFSDKCDYADITNMLITTIKQFNLTGDGNMKFNLFKLAQVAQTALDVADNVNSTYIISHNDDDELSTYAQEPEMTGSERTMSMVRAAVNQDWFDLAKLGFDALVNLVSKEPLSYQNYLAAISQYIDVKIQQFSNEESLRFVGGECLISVDRQGNSVKSKAQMYFKNENDKWIVKEMTGNTSFNCFTAETLDGEITEIMLEGGRKFPITPPQQ